MKTTAALARFVAAFVRTRRTGPPSTFRRPCREVCRALTSAATTRPGLLGLVGAVSLVMPAPPAPGADSIPEHRRKQIHDAAPATARVAPRQARRVLIWNTPAHLMESDPHKGYCIPYGTAAFEALGRKTGAFEPVVSDDLAQSLPENLRRFDAIVLNNSSGPWITPTEADLARPEFRRHGADKTAVEGVLRSNLLHFVAHGGGVVAIHFAIAANRQWPEFKELLGATFTGHPWNEEIGVTVEEPDHPLVGAFGGKDFRLADEIYEYGPPYDRGRLRVLLSLDPARSNLGVKWINRKDNDFALAWVKSHGRGRVFNTSFGHRTELFWHPPLLQYYLDAVQFATGDLEAPTAPRADRPVREIPGTAPAPGLEGFVSLFNGRDLAGWAGDPRVWSVRDGVLTGRTTPEVRVTENSFLVWKDEVEDFELRLKFRLEGGNSGIYYRARKRPAGQAKGEPLAGPQADFSADGRWTGVIMEYTLREVLAERGQQVRIETNGARQVTGSLGDPAQLLAAVKPGEWNDYTLWAKGSRVRISINGVPMAELEDRDAKRLTRGWLAVQVHTGPPMQVQFRDIFFRRL
jgi:type 1 glutamine amidotransferase